VVLLSRVYVSNGCVQQSTYLVTISNWRSFWQMLVAF